MRIDCQACCSRRAWGRFRHEKLNTRSLKAETYRDSNSLLVTMVPKVRPDVAQGHVSEHESILTSP